MMLASSGVAMAQESSPAAEGPMLFPAGCVVIAEGLNQPRYLTVAADGTVYVTEAGGVQAAASMFAFAAAVHIPCILGSQAEMGIGTAACAHLGVALPNLHYPCETFGPLRYVRDVITRPVPIEGGYLSPPDGPGLGVEIDDDALEAMRVR